MPVRRRARNRPAAERAGCPIRPDSYLGLVADSAHAAVLSTYLADTLGVTQPATV